MKIVLIIIKIAQITIRKIGKLKSINMMTIKTTIKKKKKIKICNVRLWFHKINLNNFQFHIADRQ